MKTHEIGVLLNKLTGARDYLVKEIKSKELDLNTIKDTIILWEEAKEILKIVSLKTQQQLQLQISDITTLAMEAVFPDPYTINIDFIERRGKTECDIFFVRNDNKIDPLESSGYGAVDIAAFALRIASWVLDGKSRNIIILDEPMRFLSDDLRPQASRMLKELSSKLNLQLIMITHDPQFTVDADQIVQVFKHKKFSKIKIHTNSDNYGTQ